MAGSSESSTGLRSRIVNKGQRGVLMARSSGKVALIAGVTGQDGAYLARFLLGKGYVVHGTSRDAALARLDGLIALGIRDQVTLHSMSPADFQSVAQVIEGVAPDEIAPAAESGLLSATCRSAAIGAGLPITSRRCGKCFSATNPTTS